jgi:hypothetical protein
LVRPWTPSDDRGQMGPDRVPCSILNETFPPVYQYYLVSEANPIASTHLPN